MLYPVMPVYLKSIGFSVLFIGILEGLAEATAGLSKGYFGNLSDRYNKRLPFIQAGYSLSAVSKPLLAILTFPIGIFIARTMDRFGKGIRTSARDAMLSDESATENKGKVFGFHRGMDTVGAAIGPFLALIFLAIYPQHYKSLFFIAFIPGVLAISLTFLIKEKKAKSDEQSEKVIESAVSNDKRVGFFSFLSYWKRSSTAYKQLVIGLLGFTFFNSSDMFLLLGLKNHGFSDVTMISFYIFYNLIYAAFAYPVGLIADKIGLKRVIIFGLIMFSFVYISFGFAHSFWIFGILFFVYGIFAASNEGIFKALITNISDKNETATSIGFFNSFSSIFALLSSTIGGLIWVSFGPEYTFIFSGAGALLIVFYFAYLFTFKKINKPGI